MFGRTCRSSLLIAPLLTVVSLAALSGCGTDHGQASALQACEDYAQVLGGALVQGPALASQLDGADRLAQRAASTDPRWEQLARSMAQLRRALSDPATPAIPATPSIQPGPATPGPAELAKARIAGVCGLAANGGR